MNLFKVKPNLTTCIECATLYDLSLDQHHSKCVHALCNYACCLKMKVAACFRWWKKCRIICIMGIFVSILPLRGLCGAPLWRLRWPVGLPLSSRRPSFCGGQPMSGLLLPRRSGLSRSRGLSPPPRSIPLHTTGGTPARG